MESYQRKKTGSFLLNSKTRKLVKKAIVIVVKETAEAKSDGRRINEADFVCTIIWYRTQYMNYIILGIVEFMLVGVLAAGAFVLALESEVRNWQC